MNEPSPSLRLVVFDLGGVVFSHSFDRALAHWARVSGADVQTLKTLYRHDEAYALHEVDRITIDEYRDHVCRVLGITVPLDQFITGWNAIFEHEIVGTADVVAALGRTHRVAALSNTNRTHCRAMQEKYGAAFSRFDRVYFSHEIAARKPDPEAYQRVLDDYGVRASDALFLDDLEVNLEGARRLGMDTVHVTSFEAMVAGLRSRGLVP